MTAPRMFYTDPLKAAIMARDFGVKFHVDNSEKSVPIWVFGRWLENRWDKIAVVAADSEHIFQLQEGDLVQHPSGRFGYVQEINGDDVSIDVNGGDWECKTAHALMIQRNGKAFFMPENE